MENTFSVALTDTYSKETFIIDARNPDVSNDARYVNHSCISNL